MPESHDISDPGNPLAEVGLDADPSITDLYSPSRISDPKTLEKRETFCAEVLGTRPLGGTALEVGCGLGYLSAALAPRVGHVVALDRSLTHCIMAVSILYSLGRANVTVFHGSLPGLAGSKDKVVTPRERSFVLAVSYDGLRRGNLVSFSRVSRYVAPMGMALIAFPSWWFGGGSSDAERALYARGFDSGWERGDLKLGGGLEELDRGEAPPEPDWRGPDSFEVDMSWRLYHLTAGRED
jgi:SAM-dependent methyltransferase